MPSWQTATLGELVDRGQGEIKTGPFGSQLHQADYIEDGDGVPVVMPKDMVEGRINYDTTARISETKASELAQHLTQLGDVLIPRRGDLSRQVLIRKSDVGAFCGTGSLRVRLGGRVLLPEFLFWYLRTEQGRHELESRATGVTMPNISTTGVRALQICFPSPDDQRAIASILAAYDDLIDNNQQRISILNELARATYSEWFVKFRFPGYETKGANQEHPSHEWASQSLDGVLRVLESGSRPPGGIDAAERGIPSVGAENILGLGKYDYSREKYISKSFFDGMRRGRIESGDVLLYKDGAYIGRTSLFREGFPHEELAINEHVFRLRTDPEIPQSFLYFALSHDETNQRLRALNSNAAQPGISQQKLRTLHLLVPPPPLLGLFDRCVEPYLKLLFTLARQNVLLTRARELLIPKLVSGEINITDLDIYTSWVAA